MQLRRTSGRPFRVLVVIALVALAVAGVTSPAMARTVKKKKHKAPYAISESVSRRTGTPGVTVTVTGRVAPKAKGRKVTLQVRRGAGGWTSVAHENLPKASTYSLRAKLSSAGRYGVRTVIGASKKRAAGVSATRGVVVAAPPVKKPPVTTPPATTGGVWRQLATGGSHTCGVKTDGSLWCWGWNYHGELGSSTGTSTNTVFATPERVGTRADWQQVTAGDDHSCAVATDHTLWCWGSNAEGQLGVSTNVGSFNEPTPVPQQVAGSWSSVSGGNIGTCAVATDATAWCWGDNEYGNLGNGSSDTNVDSTPAQVIGTGWSSVSAGTDGACGLKSDQSLWCWGENNRGQLGVATNSGTATPNPTPLHVGSDTWSQVSSGNSDTCGVKSTGTAWCWGLNYYGELAGPTNNYTYNANSTPLQIGAGATWSAVFAGGGFHVCGQQTSGTVECWGWNYYGETGTASNNHTTNANPTPVVVSGGTMTALATGGAQSCGIRSGGAAYCWGDNDFGELGNATNAGTANANPTPLPVG